MPAFLTAEGLAKLLQKIKTVFVTKTEVSSTIDDLKSPTGTAGQSLVHRTGNETIAGTKTFSSTISGTADKALKDGSGSTITSTYAKKAGDTFTGQVVVTKNNAANGSPGLLFSSDAQNFAIMISDTTITKGTAPSATKYMGIEFYGKDTDNYNKRLGMIEYGITAANISSTYLRAYNTTSNTSTATCTISCNVNASGSAYTAAPTPATGDNSTKIATTAFVKTAVSSGSDRRIKQDFAKPSDSLLDAWGKVEWTSFRLKSEVKEDASAPVHFGAVVQDVQSILKADGLDPDRYAFMYRFKYTDEELDLASEMSEDGIPNGDKWHLKYEEAYAIEAAYLRRKCQRLEERIAALEAKGD